VSEGLLRLHKEMASAETRLFFPRFVLSRRTFYAILTKASSAKAIRVPLDSTAFLAQVFHHFRVPRATQDWLLEHCDLAQRCEAYSCMNPMYPDPWKFAQFLLYEDIGHDLPVSAFLELIRTRYPDSPEDWISQWEWRWFSGLQPVYAKAVEFAPVCKRLVSTILHTRPWETSERVIGSFRDYAEAILSGVMIPGAVRAVGQGRHFSRSVFV
jgi:hypothetical protein